MVYKELPPTCSFCDAPLKSPRFQLKVCRYEQMKTVADFHFHLCEICYPRIHDAIKTAVHEQIKQSFLTAIAKLRQDRYAAVKIG